MQVEQLVAAMTPQVFNNLRQAVETGKWPDGKALSDEQKENAMQAVLLYQAKVQQSGEHMTIGKDGEVVQKSRQELQQELKQASSNETPIARFKQDDI
ncbi:YeaC family protein [Glaciecola siphonariae]|uniref:YeaC family protein n=1 Tax=Glaciecola siphonariae TaxID=521012 RepID=A0ABV9LT07_9ALTE